MSMSNQFSLSNGYVAITMLLMLPCSDVSGITEAAYIGLTAREIFRPVQYTDRNLLNFRKD